MNNEVLRSVDENGLYTEREGLLAKMVGTLAYNGFLCGKPNNGLNAIAMVNQASKQLLVIDPTMRSSRSLTTLYNKMAEFGIVEKCENFTQFEANLDAAMEERASVVSSSVRDSIESKAGFNSLRDFDANAMGEDCISIITDAFNYVSAVYSENEADASEAAVAPSTQIIA